MAPKRPNPKEDPPAPSSSEEEEENASATENEEEEDDEVSSDQEQPPQLKATTPQSQAHLKKPAFQTSDSESEDDSETGSESDSDPPPKSTANVKPIASKPMQDTPTKPSKLKSKAASPPASASVSKSTTEGKKRGNEAEIEVKGKKRGNGAENEVKDSKRRKEGETSGGAGEKSEDGKRQRLWKEEDEIELLKGLIEFSKRGADPFKDMAAFYDFIKKSIKLDVSLAQLKDKAVRLRKKYKNNANEGEGKSFPKPHDQKMFDLSKKIWGSEVSKPATDSSAPEKAKSSKPATDSSAPEKAKSSSSNGGNSNAIVPKAGVSAENGVAHNKETKGKGKKKATRLERGMLSGEIDTLVVEKGLDMVEGSKQDEFRRRWKDLNQATLKLVAQRHQLIADVAKAMMDDVDMDEE